MKTADPQYFHKLYGVKKPRISYKSSDFIDYSLMTLISGLIVYFSYGPSNPMTHIGIGLCVYMLVGFALRHGPKLAVPLLLRRPQDALYMLIYKIQNIKPVYFVAVGVLLLENYIIHLTPGLPHHVELMRKISIYLFYIHFIGITLYRTVILIDHLRKRELVREVLMQTPWKKAISEKTNITLEIVHAYITGVLTHIVLLAPWYIVIVHLNFSVLALPLVCIINVLTQSYYFKIHNAWFYRDHWLGHNSEFEFIYLHGTHHDAIPCGLIGVAGNGHLEGFVRHLLSFPTQCFNPVIAFVYFSFVVQQDIVAHQYVPGIFPKLSRRFHEIAQHSTHHMGRLEPYSFGLKFDQPQVSEAAKKPSYMFPDELKNSIRLDEQLTGFEWHNPSYKKYLDLFDKYQK